VRLALILEIQQRHQPEADLAGFGPLRLPSFSEAMFAHPDRIEAFGRVFGAGAAAGQKPQRW
jgi:hypothetical protein